MSGAAGQRQATYALLYKDPIRMVSSYLYRGHLLPIYQAIRDFKPSQDEIWVKQRAEGSGEKGKESRLDTRLKFLGATSGSAFEDQT